MPEGHVIHRLARQYRSSFAGSTVAVTSPQGRFAAEARGLDGSLLEGTDAVGKHLFLAFPGERHVHVHLGLYGRTQFGRGVPPDPVGLVRLRLAGAGRWADLRGPAACELLGTSGKEAILARLGPDPIRRDADPEALWHRLRSSRTSIGALLMQQDAVSGVGNIYRAEVLFRARIHPLREARGVGRAAFDGLWADMVRLMRAGVRTGRIDTVRAEHLPEAMGREPRRDRHGGEVYVYRRAGQPCLVCGSRVRQDDLQGRSLYWCGRCQRR